MSHLEFSVPLHTVPSNQTTHSADLHYDSDYGADRIAVNEDNDDGCGCCGDADRADEDNDSDGDNRDIDDDEEVY